MKTTYKNISIYQHLDAAWSNRKNILLLLFFLLILFSSINVSAQDQRISNSTGNKITEVSAFMTSIKTSDVNSRNTNSKLSRLESLVNDIQPASYYIGGELKTFGEMPNSLFIDPSSLVTLNSTSISVQSIEIVTIMINAISDLEKQLDLSVFSAFPKLKYIYIISSIETSEDAISAMLKNNNSKFEVLYKIAKGA